MATPPTFVTENETVWNTSTTTKTHSVSVTNGDRIVVWGAISNSGTNNTLTVSGGGLTWTTEQSIAISNSWGGLYVWTTTATSTTSFTVTVTQAGGTGVWGTGYLIFSGSDGFGASSKTNVTSGAPSLALTTGTGNAAVLTFINDFNSVDGTSRTWRTINSITPTAGNSLERTYNHNGAIMTVYAAYYGDAGTAGPLTTGMTAPTGQKYSIISLEVKGAAAKQGSAVGNSAYAGTATGARASAGTATGTSSYAGTSTGSRTPKATATGDSAYAGSATGTRTPKATAAGTSGYAGTATGTTTRAGVGSGASNYSGSASGLRVPKATASGATGYSGSATGARTSAATASGLSAWSGSATGETPAVGVNDGSGSGSTAWIGAAVGTRTSSGSAAGGTTYAGAATGVLVAAGSATGTSGWSGSAAGFTPNAPRDVTFTGHIGQRAIAGQLGQRTITGRLEG